MKRLASAALWLAIAVECGYIVFARLVLHLPWGHLVQPLVFVLLFGSLAGTQGRIRWIATVLRIVVGAEFVLSVADRFGLLGPPGHGVSWGDFAHFVAYTRQVNAFLPSTFAPILAVLATIFETVLGVTMILGARIPYAARAAAVLLCVFGSAMSLSGLIESQFFYGVFVLAAGAWVVSMVDASCLSLDSLLRRHRRQPA